MAIKYIGNIKGGKGDQGDQGPRGLPGAPGVNGATNDAAIKANLESSQSETGKQIRKMYGAALPADINAVGDGVADDTAAIQAVFRYGGHIPAGTYLVSQEIKVHDNVTVTGAGIDKTVIRMKGMLSRNNNLITNEKNDRSARTVANRNIHISDMTLDRNGSNSDHTTTPENPGPEGPSGSAICLATVEDASISRVRAIGGYLHCIDVSASVYNGTTVELAPGPSKRVRISHCRAEDPWWDDGITTHHSDTITIENCTSWLNRPANYNSQGIEIDEGSRNVVVRDCYVNGWSCGYQVKGHGTSHPAWNVAFENCVADNVALGFDVWWISPTSAPDQTTRLATGITVKNCSVLNQRYTIKDAQPDSAQEKLVALRIAGYSSVNVSGFHVENSDGGQITVRDGAALVKLDRISFKNVMRSPGVATWEGAIAVRGNANVEIRDVTAQTPISKPAVHVGEAVASVDGVIARASGAGVAGAVVAGIWRGFTAKNVFSSGFEGDIAVGGARFAQEFAVTAPSNVSSPALPAGFSGSLSVTRHGALATVVLNDVKGNAGTLSVAAGASRPAAWTPFEGRKVSGSPVSLSISAIGVVSAPFTTTDGVHATITYIVAN